VTRPAKEAPKLVSSNQASAISSFWRVKWHTIHVVFTEVSRHPSRRDFGGHVDNSRGT
jgi:hypothetical protein